MVKETEMKVRVAIKGSGVGGCKERGWASSKGGLGCKEGAVM